MPKSGKVIHWGKASKSPRHIISLPRAFDLFALGSKLSCPGQKICHADVVITTVCCRAF